jgi:hypothetical protein
MYLCCSTGVCILSILFLYGILANIDLRLVCPTHVKIRPTSFLAPQSKFKFSSFYRHHHRHHLIQYDGTRRLFTSQQAASRTPQPHLHPRLHVTNCRHHWPIHRLRQPLRRLTSLSRQGTLWTGRKGTAKNESGEKTWSVGEQGEVVRFLDQYLTQLERYEGC